MAKLPTEFVKAPATQSTRSTPSTQAAPAQPKQPRAKRARKTSLISTEPVRDPRELLLHLTEDEYQALEEARQKLHQAGTEVTLEQMIHRVFADWMMRARAALQPPPPAAEPAQAQAPRRDERMIARLRAFVAAPLRTWRELAHQMWRTSSLRRSLPALRRTVRRSGAAST